MDKYFYFSAQLSLLTFQQEENIPTESFFKSESAKWLSKRDRDILMSVDLNEVATNKKFKTLQKCCDFEYELRYELAKYRKSLHEDFEYKTSLFPMSYLKDGSPLDSELKLLKFRWDFFDEMQSGHYSDLIYLVLYYLKLQILWRIASFDKEKGRETFLNICKLETVDA